MKVVFMFITKNNVQEELDKLCDLVGSRNMTLFMNVKAKHEDSTMVHVGFNLDYTASREELKNKTSSMCVGIMSRTTAPRVVLPGDNFWKTEYNNM